MGISRVQVATQSMQVHPKNKKIRNKKHIDYAWGYFMIAPTILGLVILNILPLLQTIYFSLCKYSGFENPRFIGLNNYAAAFHDSDVIQAIINTLVYTLISAPIGIFLSLIVAIVLNTKIKGKSVFRTIFFIPVVSTPAAIAMVWKWLLNYDYGIVNSTIKQIFGVHGPNWLADPKLVMTTLLIVGIWSGIGYNMVIFLSGLQEIPTTFYEAADIDGAGPIRKFFSITIPLISPTMFFVMVTQMISSLQIFDLIYMMFITNGAQSPALSSVQSLVFLFYRYSFETGNKGYGSTIAIILFAITMIFTAIQLFFQKKWVHYD